MVHIFLKQKINDYNTWKDGFTGHNDARKAAGQTNATVFVNPEDENQVFILLEWDSMENAQKFMSSPELKEAMKNSGASPPEVTPMKKTMSF